MFYNDYNKSLLTLLHLQTFALLLFQNSTMYIPAVLYNMHMAVNICARQFNWILRFFSVIIFTCEIQNNFSTRIIIRLMLEILEISSSPKPKHNLKCAILYSSSQMRGEVWLAGCSTNSCATITINGSKEVVTLVL